MKIQELLSPSRRFLRSTQLERDFNDTAALEGYIPTPEIEECLERITRGLSPTSGQRAWRITGDYGSGKSSFALLLANLAFRNANELPKQVRHLVRDHGLSGRQHKLLPILVTGAREPVSLVLLRALHEALTTHVDGRRSLRSREQIAEALKNPERLDETKIVQWVAAAARELQERDLFRGLLIILDEMGKFLEFAALHPERQDVYFLQQLGEASARSGEACLFCVGLLHQGFSAYADKLSDAGQREWEKVAGRFEELVFTQPLGQVATLISAALDLNPDASALRGWKSDAHQAMARAVELGLFGAAAPKTSLIQSAPSLYPLHPTVLPVLTRFFRRFGQNERSLFSFLLSSEPHALQSFATREASRETVYRLADFYDFAAHNFGHRLSTQSFRSHWNHIDNVIRSHPAERISEIRVLKTVGILNTIEAAELLPTEEVLALALDDLADFHPALKALSASGTLYRRGRSGGYALWPHTSVNLEVAITEARQSAHPLMGAVATGAMFRGDKIDVFHVGDTRAFFVGPVNTVLLTKDHVNARGVLTQGFGGGELPGSANEIDPLMLRLEWPQEQALLLASDGAWRHLAPGVISTIYGARPKLHDFVLTLAAVILAGPADDNLTLMALRPRA